MPGVSDMHCRKRGCDVFVYATENAGRVGHVYELDGGDRFGQLDRRKLPRRVGREMERVLDRVHGGVRGAAFDVAADKEIRHEFVGELPRGFAAGLGETEAHLQRVQGCRHAAV